LTCVQDDVTQFLPADFKSSTRATTSFESESLLRELLTSLKVRKYNNIFFIRSCFQEFFEKILALKAVFWIRIRIHMFSGLQDPAPLVKGMDLDPDPAPSIIKQKYCSKKNLDSYCF
jgi:hypothetical protein